MDNTINNILEDLKRQKERLALDIKRIDNAILALSSQDTLDNQPAPERKIKRRKRKLVKVKVGSGRTKEMRESSVKWSFEIDKVFDKNNNLLPGAVVEELKNNGVPGLNDVNTKKRVYATLNRKVSNEDLFKNEAGEYFKK